ncbi:MAG: glycosyltransferase [Maribacter sp.]|uniref:glycosyltransferase n=1 Tax=Maribacter sp. TaxID=1897614 RepID=UPI003C794BB2
MKIQMVHDRLARGGQERQIIELLKNIKLHSSIDVELVFFSDEIAYPEIYDLGYPVHLIKRKNKVDLGAMFKYYKLCKKFRPDIIHSWGHLSSVFAILPSTLLGTVFINQNIMDARKDLNIFDKEYFKAKLTFPFSDFIIGNSKAGLRAYNAPNSKSRCIYNGFDFKRSKVQTTPQEVRDKLNILSGPIVGMVAAFHERKDFDTFIKMAILLLNEGFEANFLAIGDGPNYERCKALVPAEFSERILLPGQMTSVESVINSFDIGVLTTNSLVHGEGISNSIIEYMVFGKPVLATDGGGTPEIVINEENGFLVPPKSPEKLAEHIRFLLERPEMAAKMGSMGQTRVKNEFSVEKMEAQYLALYEQALSKPSNGNS